MKKSRRRLLATFGTMAGVGISGCVGDETGSSGENSGDRGTQQPTTVAGYNSSTVSSPGPSALADEQIIIEEGNFVAYDFTVDSETQFQYNLNVKNSVRIDVFVISTSGFVRYKKGQFIEPIATAEDTAGGSGEFVISKGNYYFVIDHSKKLEAEPPGQFESVPAEVDVEITY